MNDKLKARIDKLGIDWTRRAPNPVVFWDIYGKLGHPVRTTISEMGPTLLARLHRAQRHAAGRARDRVQGCRRQRPAAARPQGPARAAELGDRQREGHLAALRPVSPTSIAAIQRARAVARTGRRRPVLRRARARSRRLHAPGSVRPRHRQHPRRRPADPEAEAVHDVPALDAVGAVRETARSRRSRSAQARVLLRRSAPAVRRCAAGAAPARRAGRAPDPLERRRRVFLLAESRRRARRDPRPDGQSHPARAARVHAARSESGEGGRGNVRAESEGQRRRGRSRSSASAKRWCRRCRKAACRCRSSAR